MNAPSRFYDPKQMRQISDLYETIKEAIDDFEPVGAATINDPLFVYSAEIVIRHRDGYTIGRIAFEDDQLVFELTDEDYKPVPSALPVERDDSVAAVVAAHLEAHIRQEDTASGQKR